MATLQDELTLLEFEKAGKNTNSVCNVDESEPTESLIARVKPSRLANKVKNVLAFGSSSVKNPTKSSRLTECVDTTMSDVEQGMFDPFEVKPIDLLQMENFPIVDNRNLFPPSHVSKKRDLSLECRVRKPTIANVFENDTAQSYHASDKKKNISSFSPEKVPIDFIEGEEGFEMLPTTCTPSACLVTPSPPRHQLRTSSGQDITYMLYLEMEKPTEDLKPFVFNPFDITQENIVFESNNEVTPLQQWALPLEQNINSQTPSCDDFKCRPKQQLRTDPMKTSDETMNTNQSLSVVVENSSWAAHPTVHVSKNSSSKAAKVEKNMDPFCEPTPNIYVDAFEGKAGKDSSPFRMTQDISGIELKSSDSIDLYVADFPATPSNHAEKYKGINCISCTQPAFPEPASPGSKSTIDSKPPGISSILRSLSNSANDVFIHFQESKAQEKRVKFRETASVRLLYKDKDDPKTGAIEGIKLSIQQLLRQINCGVAADLNSSEIFDLDKEDEPSLSFQSNIGFEVHLNDSKKKGILSPSNVELLKKMEDGTIYSKTDQVDPSKQELRVDDNIKQNVHPVDSGKMLGAVSTITQLDSWGNSNADPHLGFDHDTTYNSLNELMGGFHSSPENRQNRKPFDRVTTDSEQTQSIRKLTDLFEACSSPQNLEEKPLFKNHQSESFNEEMNDELVLENNYIKGNENVASSPIAGQGSVKGKIRPSRKAFSSVIDVCSYPQDLDDDENSKEQSNRTRTNFAAAMDACRSPAFPADEQSQSSSTTFFSVNGPALDVNIPEFNDLSVIYEENVNSVSTILKDLEDIGENLSRDKIEQNLNVKASDQNTKKPFSSDTKNIFSKDLNSLSTIVNSFSWNASYSPSDISVPRAENTLLNHEPQTSSLIASTPNDVARKYEEVSISEDENSHNKSETVNALNIHSPIGIRPLSQLNQGSGEIIARWQAEANQEQTEIKNDCIELNRTASIISSTSNKSKIRAKVHSILEQRRYNLRRTKSEPNAAVATDRFKLFLKSAVDKTGDLAVKTGHTEDAVSTIKGQATAARQVPSKDPQQKLTKKRLPSDTIEKPQFFSESSTLPCNILYEETLFIQQTRPKILPPNSKQSSEREEISSNEAKMRRRIDIYVSRDTVENQSVDSDTNTDLVSNLNRKVQRRINSSTEPKLYVPVENESVDSETNTDLVSNVNRNVQPRINSATEPTIYVQKQSIRKNAPQGKLSPHQKDQNNLPQKCTLLESREASSTGVNYSFKKPENKEGFVKTSSNPERRKVCSSLIAERIAAFERKSESIL